MKPSRLSHEKVKQVDIPSMFFLFHENIWFRIIFKAKQKSGLTLKIVKENERSEKRSFLNAQGRNDGRSLGSLSYGT